MIIEQKYATDNFTGEKIILNAYLKMIVARTRQENYQNEGVLLTDIPMWLNTKEAYK